jgi:TRAP-type uncharacterized transport system substrate-binding protein
MAAQTNDIELIDLGKDAESSGFYDQYPYFSKITVPADTYRGVDYASNSFQEGYGRHGLQDAVDDLHR